MTTLESISEALKEADTKRENLRQAFEDFQAHASSLKNFTLAWSDLDDHFSSIRASLNEQFIRLRQISQTDTQAREESQEIEPSPDFASKQTAGTEPSSSTLVLKSTTGSVSVPTVRTEPVGETLSRLTSLSDTVSGKEKEDPSSSKSVVELKKGWELSKVTPRLELKQFCERMDAKGLRKYILDKSKERNAIRMELSSALKCAPDPAAMVLDAMDGFYSGNPNCRGDNDPGLSAIRRTCATLLEVLIEVVEKGEIKPEVKGRAREIAMEWKDKVSRDGKNTLEALGFVHLLTAYNLIDEFPRDEVVDLLVHVAKYRQATVLCRALGLVDKVPDLIQKLNNSGKQLLALKFVSEFGLSDRFPLVPLLKAHVKESKKEAQRVRKQGKNSLQSLNEANAKEISALKSVLKYVKDHNLGSEYPSDFLEKRIEALEKQKADRKRSAAASAQRPQIPRQQQPTPLPRITNKRRRFSMPSMAAIVPEGAVGGAPNVPPFRPPHVQAPGLLPEYSAPYVSSSTGPYGLAASAPTVIPYTGGTTDLYSLAAHQAGFSGNLSPTNKHNFYPPESQVPSGYYNDSTAYGGYREPSQYHLSYYP